MLLKTEIVPHTKHHPLLIFSMKHPNRKTFLTVHHILPKCRCRKNVNHPSNRIMLWRDRHDAFHFIFGVQTFDEIVYNMHVFHYNYKHTDAWQLLFGKKKVNDIVALFERTMRIKQSLLYKYDSGKW